MRAPGVYRFICPDGRSYIGSASDCRRRDQSGLARSNSRLREAFEQWPPEQWRYVLLQRLPPACSRRELRAAEQRHIERLETWTHKGGFNMVPAVMQEGPALRAWLRWRRRLSVWTMARRRARWLQLGL